MANMITSRRVAEAIDSVEFQRVGQKTTVCCITLKNGFEVIGTSACVDPANFDEEVGKRWAKKVALDKIEELEGYRLQSELQSELEKG